MRIESYTPRGFANHKQPTPGFATRPSRHPASERISRNVQPLRFIVARKFLAVKGSQKIWDKAQKKLEADNPHKGRHIDAARLMIVLVDANTTKAAMDKHNAGNTVSEGNDFIRGVCTDIRKLHRELSAAEATAAQKVFAGTSDLRQRATKLMEEQGISDEQEALYQLLGSPALQYFRPLQAEIGEDLVADGPDGFAVPFTERKRELRDGRREFIYAIRDHVGIDFTAALGQDWNPRVRVWDAPQGIDGVTLNNLNYPLFMPLTDMKPVEL